jgi:hypothetical protein
VNGEAVGGPMRLEHEYSAGKAGVGVWVRGNGDVRAEFARYRLWRLP